MGAAATLDESALTGESRLAVRAAGRSRQLRHGQRRGPVRPRRDGHRRAQHLRRHRPPGGGGPVVEGAVRPAGRPLRAPVRAAHARDRGLRLAALGRPGPRAGGPRGRDALPAAPGGADRHRRRDQPLREARHHRQGRRRAGGDRPGPRPAVRQDRHAHRRPARTSPTSWRRRAARPRRCSGHAASLEQVSPHVLAASIVAGARERGLDARAARGRGRGPGRGRGRAGRRRRRARGHGRLRDGRRAAPGLGARRSQAGQPRGRDRASTSASTARSSARWCSTTRSASRPRA